MSLLYSTNSPWPTMEIMMSVKWITTWLPHNPPALPDEVVKQRRGCFKGPWGGDHGSLGVGPAPSILKFPLSLRYPMLHFPRLCVNTGLGPVTHPAGSYMLSPMPCHLLLPCLCRVLLKSPQIVLGKFLQLRICSASPLEKKSFHPYSCLSLQTSFHPSCLCISSCFFSFKFSNLSLFKDLIVISVLFFIKKNLRSYAAVSTFSNQSSLPCFWKIYHN